VKALMVLVILLSTLAAPVARAESPVGDATQGTLLWRTTREAPLMPAPALSTDVEMRVTLMVLRATVRQAFANPATAWAEGIYVFPLPEDAAVDHASLLDMRRSGSPDDAVRLAVIDVALRHHVVSPYTSLIAVDITPVRQGDESLYGHALETNPPHGWNYTAVFGLGQGATAGPLHITLGLGALALATGLYAFPRVARRVRG
jgi:vault protein inter-alpha-trypsin-like protein